MQPPSLHPHACVVLAIDPGKASGWAVFVCGRCVASGVASGHDGRMLAVELADVEAARAKLPLVVVAEKWSAGGWASHTAMIGLGASWGDWRTALGIGGVPASRVVRVLPQTWRARVIGSPRGARSDALKRMSMMRAAKEVGHVADDNEADAICIGIWATRAPEVGAVAAKKTRTRKTNKEAGR